MNRVVGASIWLGAAPALIIALGATVSASLATLTYLIVSLFLLVNLFKVIRLPRALTIANVPGKAVAFFSLITAFVGLGVAGQISIAKQEVELNALRTSDPVEYLRALRDLSEERWLMELRELEPQRYLAEIRTMDEDRWFREIKRLDADQYEAEVARRRPMIEVLDVQVRGVPASNIDENLRIYEELRRLAPDNKHYNAKYAEYLLKAEDVQWTVENCKNGDAAENSNAFFWAKENVKKRLKAPRTAKFPAFDYSVVYKGNCIYSVTSWVDSQNGFGALIRSDWRVELQKQPEDRWVLKSIELL